MRAMLIVLAAAAFAALCTSPTLAAATATKSTVIGGDVIAEATQATATVMAVDKAKHTVMLRMPDGKTRTLKVPKTVKNLSMLKKGDKITATVVESLAVYVEKGGPRPSAKERESVMVRPKGHGVIATRTVRVTGKIQYVDMKNRSMTVTGPRGKSMTFKVSSNVKNLDKLKAGDDVVVRYTEAMAVDLKRPTK